LNDQEKKRKLNETCTWKGKNVEKIKQADTKGPAIPNNFMLTTKGKKGKQTWD